MSAADTVAVKALAESAGALTGHVFVSATPTGVVQPLPYIVLHPAAGVDEATRFTGPPVTEHPEYIFHIVGASANSVQVTTELVKAIFKPASFVITPTIVGRRNYNGYWRSPLPIQTDTTVTPWLIFAVIEYGWTSDPA